MRYMNSTGRSKQFTLGMNSALQSIAKISQLQFDTMLSGHGDPLKPNASYAVREFYTSLQVT
jgi:hypothetical protein